MKLIYIGAEMFDKIKSSINGVFTDGDVPDELIVDVERAGESLLEVIGRTYDQENYIQIIREGA